MHNGTASLHTLAQAHAKPRSAAMTRHPPRNRELTEEERRLWDAAMRETRVLKTQRGTESGAQTAPSRQGAQHEQQATAPDRKHARLQRSATKTPPPSNNRQTDAAAGPVTSPLARREARRIVRDPEAIDARIDLHGMRQREAYPALKGFLRAGQARGHRLVLVITGKGATREPGRCDYDDWASTPFYEAPRGVLRRLVPEWLAKPEFRDVVSGVSPAHPRHGGEGALYVRLRRITPQSPPKRSE